MFAEVSTAPMLSVFAKLAAGYKNHRFLSKLCEPILTYNIVNYTDEQLSASKLHRWYCVSKSSEFLTTNSGADKFHGELSGQLQQEIAVIPVIYFRSTISTPRDIAERSTVLLSKTFFRVASIIEPLFCRSRKQVCELFAKCCTFSFKAKVLNFVGIAFDVTQISVNDYV